MDLVILLLKQSFINNQMIHYFSTKKIILILFFYIFSILFCNLFIKNSFIILGDVFNESNLDYYASWPLDMLLKIPFITVSFAKNLALYHLLFSIVIIVLLFILIHKIKHITENHIFFLCFIFAVLVSSNLIHGYERGFLQTPIKGYLGIEDISIIDFLSTYEYQQRLGFTDNEHYVRYTHPAGEMILMGLLHSIFLNHGVMSFFIGLFSLIITYYAFFHLLQYFTLDNTVSFLASGCLISLPAIQIHYIASTDAITSTILLYLLYSFEAKKTTHINIFINSLLLFSALIISFGSVFILPILAILVFFNKKFIEIGSIFGLVILYFFTLSFIFDYNYVQSFLLASKIENPTGFTLLSTPINYFLTRTESVLTILFYSSPFLLYLGYQGVTTMLKFDKYKRLLVITASGISILLLELAAGTYRTGETARTCMFIYPYLTIPAAIFLNENRFILTEKKTLIFLIVLQTIILQTFGIHRA